jgi:hypothetical protein
MDQTAWMVARAPADLPETVGTRERREQLGSPDLEEKWVQRDMPVPTGLMEWTEYQELTATQVSRSVLSFFLAPSSTHAIFAG